MHYSRTSLFRSLITQQKPTGIENAFVQLRFLFSLCAGEHGGGGGTAPMSGGGAADAEAPAAEEDQEPDGGRMGRRGG